MEGERNIVSKTVGENREEAWYIKYKDDTNMGTTCVQGFLAGIPEWKLKDRMKNKSVRDTYEDQV